MKRQLDPELAAVARKAELEQRAAMVARIKALTARVPKKVLEGSHQDAVDWKECAKKAVSLAGRDRVTSAQLRGAVLLLEQYE